MEGRTKRRVKFGLSITPYILIVALSGGYALSDIGSDIKDAKVVEDVKKEVLLPEHPIIIDDRKDEQKRQDNIVEETTVIEPEEKINISSELLDQGYEFERIDFDELKQINPDSDAWIIIDGTKIDLPIVKSIDNEFYFAGDKPYGNIYEDVEKFAFFCKASLSALPLIDFRPDIIHCHDWQTGLVPVYLKDTFSLGDFYRELSQL